MDAPIKNIITTAAVMRASASAHAYVYYIIYLQTNWKKKNAAVFHYISLQRGARVDNGRKLKLNLIGKRAYYASVLRANWLLFGRDFFFIALWIDDVEGCINNDKGRGFVINARVDEKRADVRYNKLFSS